MKLNLAKFYKFGFWLFLVIIFTSLNLLRITNSGYESELEKLKEVNEKRVSSLLVSNSITKRLIVPVYGENILNHKINNNLLKDTCLVILLSTFKCNQCQENELKRLNSLKNIFGSNGVNVIGITIKSERDAVIRQQKITKINFPIYWVNDDSFYNISFYDEFPQILFIVNNVIVSGFIPVPFDDGFSEDYLSKLINSTFWFK